MTRIGQDGQLSFPVCASRSEPASVADKVPVTYRFVPSGLNVSSLPPRKSSSLSFPAINSCTRASCGKSLSQLNNKGRMKKTNRASSPFCAGSGQHEHIVEHSLGQAECCVEFTASVADLLGVPFTNIATVDLNDGHSNQI